MAQQTVTRKVPPEQADALLERLEGAGFERRSLAHAFWQARGDGVIVSFYRSGKVVVQGVGVEPWLDVIGGGAVAAKKKKAAVRPAGDDFEGALAKLPSPPPSAWIGTDEAGKGDYFGPLVIAAARVTPDILPLLVELGVDDSKRLADDRALKLGRELEATVEHKVMMLMPERYNDLYARIGNLNQLMAWGHAAVIEDLLAEHDADVLVVDQFARGGAVKRRLKERGRQRTLIERVRAEDDPAVACASILARAAFLRGLRSLERRHGVRLAKGAGSPVLSAGRALVQAEGPEILPKVAKTHFKTTQQIS